MDYTIFDSLFSVKIKHPNTADAGINVECFLTNRKTRKCILSCVNDGDKIIGRPQMKVHCKCPRQVSVRVYEPSLMTHYDNFRQINLENAGGFLLEISWNKHRLML